MIIMKHYLIDSENVGDFWIPLLELPAESTELIVFYTKNSPHMSYDSLIKLKESDRTVTFIKCYEGTNALDFQLCSELGFRIASDKEDEFIIVTNDTGYDAAVKYWRHKEYSVKRIAGKDTRAGGRRRGNYVRTDVAAEVSSILNVQVQEPEDNTAAEVTAESAEAGMESAPVFEPEVKNAADAPAGEAPEENTAEPDKELDQESDIETADAERDHFDEAPEGTEDTEDTEAAEYMDEAADVEISGEEEPEDTVPVPEPSEDRIGPEEDVSEDPDPGEESHDAPEITAQSEEEAAGDDESSETADSVEAAVTDEKISSNTADSGALPAEHKTGTEIGEESDAGTKETEPGEDAPFIPDMEEITAIVNCIGMDNLAELHNQLIQFYGDHGKEAYQAVKNGTFHIEKENWSREEKFLYYSALIFRHSDEPDEARKEENIREFADFLLGAEKKRQNLNSLRYALLKHYGKEKGRRYYFLLKPYVKALNQM